MAIIGKIIRNLTPQEYCEMHLTILNPFLPVKLAPKEREILGFFMSLDSELAQVDRFNSRFRKEMRDKLGMSYSGLTNHLTALEAKGILELNLQGVLSIKPYLFPQEDNGQVYNFKLIKADGN